MSEVTSGLCAGSWLERELVVVFECKCLRTRFHISDYLKSVLRQNIAFFDRLGAGEVTNRVSHDVDLIQDGISDKVSLNVTG